ncbi:hypothetical protein JL720_16234 [Aureococcus anophagefferens]|nr:hypothetical protein JL720_16234 [Aureococcus anophagefferens]
MDRKDASRLARAPKGNRDAAQARDAATERLGVVASAIVPVGDGTALFYGGELARNKRLPCVLSVAPKTGVVCDAPLWTESDELDATSFCAGAKRGEEFLFFGGLDRYFRVTSLLRSAVSLRKKTGTSTAKKYLFRSYKASDDTPSPRYGCSFTYFAESGEMFLFGGFTASQAGSLAVVADDAKLYTSQTSQTPRRFDGVWVDVHVLQKQLWWCDDEQGLDLAWEVVRLGRRRFGRTDLRCEPWRHASKDSVMHLINAVDVTHDDRYAFEVDEYARARSQSSVAPAEQAAAEPEGARR